MTGNLSQIADEIAHNKEDTRQLEKMSKKIFRISHYVRPTALQKSSKWQDIRKNARDITRLS